MQLDKLQELFAAHLLQPSHSTDDLSAKGPFAVEQLLQVYRNNFVISLSEYLTASFSVVYALVGDEFFAQLAKSYIRDVPLTQAPIEGYGVGFPEYIAQCEQTESVPYLADIARIEWAIDRAKLDYKDSPFPFADLESLNPTDQNRLCFELRTSAVTIVSDYPVVSIWQGVKTGNLDHIDMTQAEVALVFSGGEAEVKLLCVTPVEYQFLSAIRAKKNVQQLASFEFLQQYLSHFIGEGTINSFYLSPENLDDQ